MCTLTETLNLNKQNSFFGERSGLVLGGQIPECDIGGWKLSFYPKGRKTLKVKYRQEMLRPVRLDVAEAVDGGVQQHARTLYPMILLL